MMDKNTRDVKEEFSKRELKRRRNSLVQKKHDSDPGQHENDKGQQDSDRGNNALYSSPSPKRNNYAKKHRKTRKSTSLSSLKPVMPGTNTQIEDARSNNSDFDDESSDLDELQDTRADFLQKKRSSSLRLTPSEKQI
jgi:predicted DNA binding CopG/RHH family protein